MGWFENLSVKLRGLTQAQEYHVSEDVPTIGAPVAGELVAQKDIPDPVFASGALGATIGIWPEDGTVFSPVSGTISQAMSHAVAIDADSGEELLVHVGVDTVELSGKGFALNFVRNDRVRAGDVLMTFDRQRLREAGYPDIVMVTLSNSADYSQVKTCAAGHVSLGEKIMEPIR
ncbi:MAG: PTS sugar transporter subunit IIA [Atopobiaceae bacterium]